MVSVLFAQWVEWFVGNDLRDDNFDSFIGFAKKVKSAYVITFWVTLTVFIAFVCLSLVHLVTIREVGIKKRREIRRVHRRMSAQAEEVWNAGETEGGANNDPVPRPV